MALDRIDRQILAALQSDGRATHTRIAAEVGLTPPAVLERVRKLEERGAITGYQAQLDPDAVGLPLRVFIAVTLARHQENAIDAFLKSIAGFPPIVAHHHVTGRFDFILQGRFGDVRALEQFIAHRLTALPVIDRAETFLVLSGRDTGPLPVTLDDDTAQPVSEARPGTRPTSRAKRRGRVRAGR